jgi:hypothetical protein
MPIVARARSDGTFSAASYHREFSELKDKIDASLTNKKTESLVTRPVQSKHRPFCFSKHADAGQAHRPTCCALSLNIRHPLRKQCSDSQVIKGCLLKTSVPLKVDRRT